MTDSKQLPEASKALTAEDIFAVEDLEIVEVEVPEWKGKVCLRVLPADEGLAVNEEMQALEKGKQHESLFLLLGACIVDKDGKRLFATPDQAKRLRTRSQKVLLRLQQRALELQGWGPESPAKNG